MDNWKKLEELVSQNQFELLTNYGNRKWTGADSDLRLVYLMNDAAESFLVFRNAVMTGTYIEEFEGEIWADFELSELEMQESEKEGLEKAEAGRIKSEKPEVGRTCIILHQEENIVTIFFDRLDFEVYLFDYSKVGHFWVKGYEYLRQLEFKIAILGDKYRYIGKESCSDMEQRLAALCEFPPLGYCCYPAVPQKYIVPRKDVWRPSKEAIEMMREIAEKAGDSSYMKWLAVYKLVPTRWMGRLLARKLHQTRHVQISKLLMKSFEEGCAAYPSRYLRKLHTADSADSAEIEEKMLTEDGKKSENRLARREVLLRKMRMAQDKMMHLQERGKDAELFFEEAFWFADDGLEDKVYLGVWEYGQKNTSLKIEEIQ